MWFLLEEGRFHNVFDDKPAKWLITKFKIKKKTIKIYTHNQFKWLCKKVWSLKVYNAIIYKIKKTTLEPWGWS